MLSVAVFILLVPFASCASPPCSDLLSCDSKIPKETDETLIKFDDELPNDTISVTPAVMPPPTTRLMKVPASSPANTTTSSTASTSSKIIPTPAAFDSEKVVELVNNEIPDEVEETLTPILKGCKSSPKPCQKENMKCTDQTMGLGYYCSCVQGFAEVYSKNGEMYCGKPLLLTQKFQLPYKVDYANTTSLEFQRISEDLVPKIRNVYFVEERALITIQKITSGSLVVWFEATPIGRPAQYQLGQLQQDHKLARDQNRLGNMSKSPAEPVAERAVVCFPAKIRSRVLLSKATNWTFGEAKPDSWTLSNENCIDSPNIGYVASILCRIRNDSGVLTGYYDPNSLKETACIKDPWSALPKLGQENVTMETFPNMMASMAVISSKFGNSTSLDLQNFVLAYDHFSEEVEKNSIEVSEFIMNSIMWAADNLHGALSERIGDVLNDAERTSFLLSLETFADKFAFSGHILDIITDSLKFEAATIDGSAKEFTFVKPADNTKEKKNAPLVIAHVPLPSIQNSSNSTSKKIIFFLHNDAVLFPRSPENDTEFNKVLSIQITNTTLENMKEPVNITFPQSKKTVKVSKVNGCSYVAERCAYLNLSTGTWQYNGCTTHAAKMPGYTSCSCNHATNFAVLVKTFDVKNSYALDIIGKIGVILSIVGLTLTIIIHLCFRQLRSKKLNQVHLNLCASLLLGYVTFLAGVERPRLYAPCMATTAILQASFLSAWGWMVVEFYVMYRKLIQVFNDIHGAFVIKAAFAVYVGSVAVTMITWLVAYVAGDSSVLQTGWMFSKNNDPSCWKSFYASDRLCWLHSYSLYFGFLVPIGIMFLVNFVGFVGIMHRIYQKKPNLGRGTGNKSKVKTHAIRFITISCLLGVTWIFAIPLTISDDTTLNEIFSWLFSLSNAFQGFIFFIVFCVLRSSVRKQWLGSFFVCFPNDKEETKALDTSTADKTVSTSVTNENKSSKGDIKMQKFYVTTDTTAVQATST